MEIEKNHLIEKYNRSLLDEELETLKAYDFEIQEFIRYSTACGLSIPIDAISYLNTIGLVAKQNDILTHLIPELVADKEGLFSWTDITRYLSNKNRNGFFYHEKFMVMFHPFFRRNLSDTANYAPGIVNAFIFEEQKKNQVLSIAIDLHRLRINVDDTFYAEFDTWFGPRFYNEIGRISDGPSKLAPPPGLSESFYDRWFSNTKFLDILWTSHQHVREFQLEEIKAEIISVNYRGKIFHPVRYIHAEFDEETGYFRHMDGAVHLYSDDEYEIRTRENLNINVENFRNRIKPLSVKLFKINGQIPSSQFVSYCSLFLVHDPLIHEYFTGKMPEPCAKAIKFHQTENNLKV